MWKMSKDCKIFLLSLLWCRRNGSVKGSVCEITSSPEHVSPELRSVDISALTWPRLVSSTSKSWTVNRLQYMQEWLRTKMWISIRGRTCRNLNIRSARFYCFQAMYANGKKWESNFRMMRSNCVVSYTGRQTSGRNTSRLVWPSDCDWRYLETGEQDRARDASAEISAESDDRATKNPFLAIPESQRASPCDDRGHLLSLSGIRWGVWRRIWGRPLW